MKITRRMLLAADACEGSIVKFVANFGEGAELDYEQLRRVFPGRGEWLIQHLGTREQVDLWYKRMDEQPQHYGSMEEDCLACTWVDRMAVEILNGNGEGTGRSAEDDSSGRGSAPVYGEKHSGRVTGAEEDGAGG